MDACLISSANYLGQARVMLASYRKHNPDGRFFLLLLDEPAKNEDLTGWTVIRAEELGLSDLPALRMLYTTYELSMALRPSFMLHLMHRHDAERIAFMDADLYFTGSIGAIDVLLETHSIILTPSYLTPIPEDGRFPSDRDYLAAGMYNGGFTAYRRCAEAETILHWLHERLRKYSFLRPEDNMFGDQRWMDLVPSFAKDLLILRDPAFNVAYWNLHERTITASGDQYLVNGKPMIFFHFSGFKPDSPPVLSIHQTRTKLSDHPALLKLCLEYQERILEEKHEEKKRQPYAFDQFDNGVRVTPILRRVYEEIDGAEQFADPFSTAGDSFFRWLCEPLSFCGKTLPITNLHETIHEMSIEAAGRFPRPKSADLKAFAFWILQSRKNVLPLDPVFLAPLEEFLTQSGGESAGSRVHRFLNHRHFFGPYQALCRFMKQIIGEKIYNRIKPRDEFPTIPRFLLKTKRSGRTGGVNVVAGIGAASGVGEAVRGHIEAFKAAGIPVALADARTAPGRERGVLPEQRQNPAFPFATTFVEGGLDDLRLGIQFLPKNAFTASRLIGHLAWELETIPEYAIPFLNQFDELWTPSRFVTESVSKALSIPVLTMPHVVNVRNPSKKTRTDFGIPNNATVFLFVFDFYSHIERKNPLGLIEAFRKAFGDDPDKLLIIKHSYSESFPEEFKTLNDAIHQSKNIRLIGEYLSRPDLLALIKSADAYVSLHRAEGFGLTMAEAMALGVPVLGTDYGGSTDFLTDETGFPIPFTLQTIIRTIGPYEQGMTWAEPDLDAAAEAMRSIITNQDDAKARATRAKTFIEENFSAKCIGERMKKRVIRQVR